jgi:hypothetical protein
MKEGDTIFETGIGRLFDGSFCFRARGERVAEFYQKQEGGQKTRTARRLVDLRPVQD